MEPLRLPYLFKALIEFLVIMALLSHVDHGGNPCGIKLFFHQGQLVIRTAGRKQKDEFIHSLLREKNELFPKRA